MRTSIFLFVLVVLFGSSSLSQQKKALSENVSQSDEARFIRVELDSTCNMNFLGVRVKSVVFIGTKSRARDFFKRFFDFIGGSDAMLNRNTYFDSFEERGFAKKVTDTANFRYYLIAVSIPNPDDFSKILNYIRTQEVGNKLNCDLEKCIKICDPAKVCISAECLDYSAEICYDGKFEASFSNGVLNLSFPTKLK